MMHFNYTEMLLDVILGLGVALAVWVLLAGRKEQ